MKLFAWLILLMTLSVSAAEWDDPKYRLDVASATLNRLKTEIQQLNDEPLKKLSEQVTLVVSENGPDEPQSSITSAGRKVDIPDLFIAKTANLARMARLARDGTDQACAYRYKAHMEQTGSRLPLESYLKSAPPECASLKTRLPLGPMGEALADREISATLVFTFLHELGHQFHNHQGAGIRFPPNVNTKENQCAFLGAMKLRRELEYEADDFAVDSLAKLGSSQLVFFVGALWLLPPATDDSSKVSLDQMFGERLAAHPNSGFRWARILDRTAAILSKQAPLNPQITQLLGELKDWQQRAKQAVAENDKALSPC